MSGRMGAAGAVVVLCLIVGCSGGDPPAGIPDPTTAAPTTSVVTPTTSEATTPSGPPALPDAATLQTPEGAEAFVRHWFKVLSYSQGQMDSSPVRAISVASCLTCSSFADTIDSVTADGNQLDGGEISIENLEASAVAADGGTTINVLISFAEQRILDRAGSSTVLAPAEPSVQSLISLTWKTGWLLGELQLIA